MTLVLVLVLIGVRILVLVERLILVEVLVLVDEIGNSCGDGSDRVGGTGGSGSGTGGRRGEGEPKCLGFAGRAAGKDLGAGCGGRFGGR